MEELSRHDAAVKRIVEEDEQCVWYQKRWNKSPDGFTLQGFIKYLSDYDLTCQPDAWSVSFVSGAVYWLEVIDTHRPDAAKLKQLESLFWELDQIEFALILVIHDINLGVTITVSPEQMVHWIYTGCKVEPWKVQVPAVEEPVAQ